MTYTPTQVPANLDSDGLRKWTQDEFRRLAQAYADDMKERDELIANLTLDLTDAVADIATNTTDIATINNRPQFHVHKNSVDQNITGAAATLVTWGTEVFDIGSKFASNRWTPSAGRVLLTWTMWVTVGGVNAILYKNGAAFKGTFEASASNALVGAVIDQANGTDYYEIYVTGGGGGAYVVKGDPVWTFFSGSVLVGN